MDDIQEWLRLLTVVEGGSFAGLCNMALVCLVVYSLRPKQPSLSPSTVWLTLLYLAGAVVVLLVCLGTVGVIGLS